MLKFNMVIHWNPLDFCSDKYKNIKDYLADIMLVNGMYDEEVLPGSYLIVPYYSVEFK